MLMSNLLKIVFILFAAGGALIYKLANLVLSKLMFSDNQVNEPTNG